MSTGAETYIANLEVLPHEQVERGGRVTPDGADAAAAVTQEAQAQVGTQLRVLLEQHLWELDQTTGEFDMNESLSSRRTRLARYDQASFSQPGRIAAINITIH